MKQNSSGKILTIFMVIVIILMSTLAAAAMFFLNKETENRKYTEALLEKSRAHEAQLDDDLKKSKKENFLLQEKNKEADDRINDLSGELDLEKGLREELKRENLALKDQMEKDAKLKQDIEQKLADSTKKIDELTAQVKTESDKRAEAEQRSKELQDKITNLPQEIGNEPPQAQAEPKDPAVEQAKSEIQLDKIVVSPTKSPEGRILAVDNETEFVIFNLGEKDGIKAGDFMSVFRGKDYLGDVKVTRVQPEMSAADIVPPFSSRLVRKNDQVVVKQ